MTKKKIMTYILSVVMSASAFTLYINRAKLKSTTAIPYVEKPDQQRDDIHASEVKYQTTPNKHPVKVNFKPVQQRKDGTITDSVEIPAWGKTVTETDLELAVSNMESEFWEGLDTEHDAYRNELNSAFNTAFVNNSIVDANINEVECNSQLCRVAIDYSPEPAQEKEPSIGLLDRLSGIPPLLSDHLAQTIFDSDGRQQMIIYIARNGQLLPLKL